MPKTSIFSHVKISKIYPSISLNVGYMMLKTELWKLLTELSWQQDVVLTTISNLSSLWIPGPSSSSAVLTIRCTTEVSNASLYLFIFLKPCTYSSDLEEPDPVATWRSLHVSPGRYVDWPLIKSFTAMNQFSLTCSVLISCLGRLNGSMRGRGRRERFRAASGGSRLKNVLK